MFVLHWPNELYHSGSAEREDSRINTDVCITITNAISIKVRRGKVWLKIGTCVYVQLSETYIGPVCGE